MSDFQNRTSDVIGGLILILAAALMAVGLCAVVVCIANHCHITPGVR